MAESVRLAAPSIGFGLGIPDGFRVVFGEVGGTENASASRLIKHGLIPGSRFVTDGVPEVRTAESNRYEWTE